MSILPRTHNDAAYEQWREDSAEQTPPDDAHPITYFIGPETSVAWAASIEPRPQDRIISYPQPTLQEAQCSEKQ